MLSYSSERKNFQGKGGGGAFYPYSAAELNAVCGTFSFLPSMALLSFSGKNSILFAGFGITGNY